MAYPVFLKMEYFRRRAMMDETYRSALWLFMLEVEYEMFGGVK